MLDKSYSTINFLSNALNGTWRRHEAISNNIANVNTPGYKKTTVNFENMLKGKLNHKKMGLKVTNEKHMSRFNEKNQFKPIIKQNNNTSSRDDKNNVNIDVEMANLAKNTIMYNTLIRQTASEFNKIKTVINEGRK